MHKGKIALWALAALLIGAIVVMNPGESATNVTWFFGQLHTFASTLAK